MLCFDCFVKEQSCDFCSFLLNNFAWKPFVQSYRQAQVFDRSFCEKVLNEFQYEKSTVKSILLFWALHRRVCTIKIQMNFFNIERKKKMCSNKLLNTHDNNRIDDIFLTELELTLVFVLVKLI